MRKLLLVFIALFLSFAALAQLEVKPGSFKEVQGFVNINLDKQQDDNNVTYAIIKVNTENINDKQRHELYFQGNAATYIELEYKIGEVWVYLSSTPATFLKISHPDFGSTEFWFPHDLKPKQGYELILVNKSYQEDNLDVYNYLIVRSDQPNAMVYFDDVFVGEQEASKSYLAGEKHKWRIECDMYHPENGEEIISSTNNVTIEKQLRPAFGFAEITSKPEDDAVVFIDGKKVGNTPFKSDKLSSGQHKIMLAKEMFKNTEQLINIKDNDNQKIEIKMMIDYADVSVTTDSVSDIYIDNELKNRGQWNGRLSGGSHLLEARKENHKTTALKKSIIVGKNEKIVIESPKPIVGILDVNSTPMGAKIILDGKELGVTPSVYPNVLIGTHALRIEKEGYKTVEKSVTIAEKKRLLVEEKLEKGKNIAFFSREINAAIFIDGEYFGIYPITDEQAEENMIPKNYWDAVESYKTKANNNDATAQNNLGVCYLYGKGVEKNGQKAVELFRKSAEQGNAVGQANLARCYWNGLGVEKDYNEAFAWAKKSAVQDNAAAYNLLGVFYQYGDSYKVFPTDTVQAKRYYTMSAEQGFALAQWNLGTIQKITNKEDYLKWIKAAAEQGLADAQNDLGNAYFLGNIVKQDYSEAVKWYKLAAEQGFASAQMQLGHIYYTGKGVKIDDNEAVRYTQAAADQGNSNAQYNLGFFYQNGHGVEQNLKEAVRWYQLSAAQNNLYAITALGFCYQDGKGVTKDCAKAVEYFRKAADKNWPRALSGLGYCYETGCGVAKDEKEAVRYYRMAAEKGDMLGEQYLGFCYDEGKGVEKNKEEAKKWLQKAADKGSSGAQRRLWSYKQSF